MAVAGTVTPAGGDLAERLAAVRARIDAAAAGRPVRLVAVTKGFGDDVVAAALAAGLEDLGESYAGELAAKAAAVAERGAAVRWHFVGRIQRNKVRTVAPVVDLWHGVDRAAAGREVAKRAPGAAVLVQVNVTGEAHKGGCVPANTAALVDELRAEGLDVRGLMAMGPAGPPEGARAGFRTLARLADELGLPERSMGMTGDLEVAIEEGATIVRVGRGLFGERPGAPPGGGVRRNDPLGK